MPFIDTVLLVCSMIVVVGISSLLPIMAYKEYKYEKKRNQDFQKTTER